MRAVAVEDHATDAAAPAWTVTFSLSNQGQLRRADLKVGALLSEVPLVSQGRRSYGSVDVRYNGFNPYRIENVGGIYILYNPLQGNRVEGFARPGERGIRILYHGFTGEVERVDGSYPAVMLKFG